MSAIIKLMTNTVSRQASRGVLYGLFISLILILVVVAFVFLESYGGNWIGCSGKLLRFGICRD